MKKTKILQLMWFSLALPGLSQAAMLGVSSGSVPSYAPPKPVETPYVADDIKAPNMNAPSGTPEGAIPSSGGSQKMDNPSQQASNDMPSSGKPKRPAYYSDSPDETDEPELYDESNSEDKLKREAAFQALVDNKLPMSPKQIRKLHKMLDLTHQAISSEPGTPPTSVSSTVQVRLDPGAAMPVIRLAAGFVTSIVFLDITGAPWPIEAYSIGDPGTFNIQWDKTSNIMFMQANKRHVHGNLAIKLVGENTPMMISLVSAQKEVDYRLDLQVAGRGPNAAVPIAASISGAKFNNAMVQVLDNIPPIDSQKLSMNEAYGQAWLIGDTLYFRSKLQVLSPAWRSKVSSPDGMHVYELMQTPLLLVSSEGRTVSIQLKGF